MSSLHLFRTFWRSRTDDADAVSASASQRMRHDGVFECDRTVDEEVIVWDILAGTYGGSTVIAQVKCPRLDPEPNAKKSMSVTAGSSRARCGSTNHLRYRAKATEI